MAPETKGMRFVCDFLILELVGPLGIEPRLQDPQPCVLPLYNGPELHHYSIPKNKNPARSLRGFERGRYFVFALFAVRMHLTHAFTRFAPTTIHCRLGYFLCLVVGFHLPRSFLRTVRRNDVLPHTAHDRAIEV